MGYTDFTNVWDPLTGTPTPSLQGEGKHAFTVGTNFPTRARLRGRVTTFAPMPVNPVSRLFCAVRLWDP